MITLSTSNQAGLANQASSAQSNTAKSIETISSGSRLSPASSDIASFSIASRLKAEITHNDQAIKNAADAQSLLQTADSGLGEIQAILQELRSVSVQSMNGTYSSTDTAAMNTHAQQLLSEIDSIASSTKWAGSGLLDGNSAYLNFTTGEAASSSASLTACIPGFKSANLGLASLTLNGTDVHSSGLAVTSSLAIGDTGAGSKWDPEITKLTNGNFVAVYGVGNNGGTAIHGQIISSDGMTVVADIDIIATGTYPTPQVTATSDGGFLIAYHNVDNNQSVGIAKYNSSGSRLQNTSFSSGLSWAHNTPDLVGLENGKSVVVYHKNAASPQMRTAYGMLIDQNGNKIGEEFIISDEENSKLEGYVEPSVTATKNGGFFVATNVVANDSNIVGQFFDANGAKIGSEFYVVETNDVASAPFAQTLDDGRIAVAWRQGGGNQNNDTAVEYKLKIIADDGAAITATTDGNTTTFVSSITGNGPGAHPIISNLDGNDFLVSWSTWDDPNKQGSIIMQRFSACGDKLGGEMNLQTSYNKVNGFVSAARNDDGNLMITFAGDEKGQGPMVQLVSPYETGETSKLNMIDDAIAYVVQHRAALGANINRLSSAISNLTTLSHNKKASLGTVADADMATEVTQLAKSQLLAQASVAMTAQANNSMYEVLKLIKD